MGALIVIAIVVAFIGFRTSGFDLVPSLGFGVTVGVAREFLFLISEKLQKLIKAIKSLKE